MPAARPLLPWLLAATMLALCGVVNADQRDPRLPALFEKLQATEDAEEGDRIGRRIAHIWNESGLAGIDDVMKQGQRFMEEGNLKLALGNFTTVTTLEPGFAEGWNKRAAVLYRMGRFDAAQTSVERTLALEPRHFLALAGLGVIHMRTGKLEEALRAFEVALRINPHLTVTRGVAERLRRQLRTE